MRAGIGIAVVSLLIASGVGPIAQAQAQLTPSVAPSIASRATPVGTVTLNRVVTTLNPGQVWGETQAGLLCFRRGPLVWKSGFNELNTREFQAAFRQSMQSAGFKVAGDPTNLFARAVPDSDFAVAGAIHNIHYEICYPYQGNRNTREAKGDASIDIEWQVYSRQANAVVAKVRTLGAYRTESTLPAEGNPILLNAFADSVRRLAAEPAFRKVFVEAPVNEAAAPTPSPAAKAPIELNGASIKSKRAISDAVGSVVMIMTEKETGSGVLVSRDGYILTDQHVVGDAKFVKIRWSDGFETQGEIVRASKVRDVALIKSETHGRAPLAIRTGPVEPGETVFAIGAPLGARYQNTVTRGIVSANRIMNGMAFIQSDVTVNHGNSGGPLLDESGAVIGLADLMISKTDSPAGLNLFTPSQDALDFLGLKLKP